MRPCEGGVAADYFLRIHMSESIVSLRADKYLHHVRIFKTRALAAQACSKGNVKIKGDAIKPARDVRAGDSINIERGDLHVTIRVLSLPAHRVGAPRAKQCYEDLTPPEEYERAAAIGRERALIHPPTPHESAARPNKKQMRDLREWMGLD
jgi:ribosome-associated heat shock protein Hsp15